jgi:Fe-S cluster biosynthesis and repair protein YggX
VFASLTSDPREPANLKEALTEPDRNKWIVSIKAEIMNFISQEAWKKVSRHHVTQFLNSRLINCMLSFKRKTEQNNSIRYKTRIVSKGYMQIPGVDYTELFAPVASDTAIRWDCLYITFTNFHQMNGSWNGSMLKQLFSIQNLTLRYTLNGLKEWLSSDLSHHRRKNNTA